MDASLVDPNLSLTDLSSVLQAVGAHVGYIMDGDEDVSTPGSPVLESDSLSPDQLALEKQRATLKTYVDSVPYECEPEEVMLEKLEDIVGKLSICVETKNWLLFSTWDGALQWYAVFSFTSFLELLNFISTPHIPSAGSSCGIPFLSLSVQNLYISTMNSVSSRALSRALRARGRTCSLGF